MKETYTKLMVQQEPSPEADAAFYEKLENTNTVKKRKPVWKAAVVAACIFLLIPVTVLAAKYIIHKPQVNEIDRVVKREACYNQAKYKPMETLKEVGYEIEFPDLEIFSIEDIPEKHRYKENTSVPYDSWNAAADALDMGLLKNSFLDSDVITPILVEFPKPYGSEPTHCSIGYCCSDDQPFNIYQQARYKYEQIEFEIIANISLAHPLLTEDDYTRSSKSSYSAPYLDRPRITSEEYTTTKGIPMVITKRTTTSEYQINLAHYDVDFAVNNIKYHIGFYQEEGYMFREHNYIDEVEALIPQILEGFTLE